jgi:hypothetical protein
MQMEDSAALNSGRLSLTCAVILDAVAACAVTPSGNYFWVNALFIFILQAVAIVIARGVDCRRHACLAGFGLAMACYLMGTALFQPTKQMDTLQLTVLLVLGIPGGLLGAVLLERLLRTMVRLGETVVVPLAAVTSFTAMVASTLACVAVSKLTR